MASRIGLNADCNALGSNRQKFIDFVVALRPPYVLLMDDGDCKVADEIHARAPEVTIIHRKFTIHDGNLHRVPQDDGTNLSPQEYLDFLKTHKRPYVIHQIFNEPAPPKGEMATLLKWLIAIMKLGVEQGMRLCVLNMQSVAIRFDELDAGVYDEFLHTCAKYAQFHIIGAHEYALADITANVSEANMRAIGETRLANVTWANVKPREAHIGRIQMLVDRMQVIGATPIPPFVMTEYGKDKVELAQYYKAIGANGGAIPLGIPSLKTYDERVMPAKLWLETELDDLKWTDSYFPSYVKGFCWFGWNYNPEWAGFNVGELDTFQRMWLLYAQQVRNQTTPPAPQPTPAPPVVSLPPSIPPLPKRDWRSELANDERMVLSLAKSGDLGAIMRTILHMSSILDELTGRNEGVD